MVKRDSKATRQRILEQAATLLNTAGYLSTSVSDIMRVTGLKKGGIYHHFESLEDLALEAFQYAVGRVQARILDVIGNNAPAKEKLLALIAIFRNLPFDDVLRGGCPIANLAIETDHTRSRLRGAAAQAMEKLLLCFQHVIEEGMTQQAFVKGDARAHAAEIIAALEGGLMLSNLYRDYTYLHGVADQLEARVKAGLR